MRADLRDAEIAAAKAADRVKPVTTLQQRRAARRAEKYRGWRRVTMGLVNPTATFTGHSEKRVARREFGPMSGRQWVRLRKAIQRERRANEATDAGLEAA